MHICWKSHYYCWIVYPSFTD